MKLCSKCIEGIKSATVGTGIETDETAFVVSSEWGNDRAEFARVPESECEFWIHKKMNEIYKELEDVRERLFKALLFRQDYAP